MADLPRTPRKTKTRTRWGGFAWTKANASKFAEITAQYPLDPHRCYPLIGGAAI